MCVLSPMLKILHCLALFSISCCTAESVVKINQNASVHGPHLTLIPEAASQEDGKICYVHIGCFSITTQPPKGAAAQPTMFAQEDVMPAQCANAIPWEMQQQLEGLRYIGLFARRSPKACAETSITKDVVSLITSITEDIKEQSVALVGSAPLSDASLFGAASGIILPAFEAFKGTLTDQVMAYSLLFLWIAVWGTVLINRVLMVLFPARPDDKVRPSDERLEMKAWKQGLWSWITTSWATTWVRKFGMSMNQGNVRITCEDLGKLGHPDDEALSCFQRFKQLWDDEVERKSGKLDRVNLWFILLNFVGPSNLLRLLAVKTLFTIAGFISAVYVLEFSINFIVWMQEQAKIPGAILPALLPTICVLFCFWLLPLSRMMLSSTYNMMDGRLCMRMMQALRVAVYYKAQRLPTKCIQDQVPGRVDVVNATNVTEMVDEEILKHGAKDVNDQEPNLVNLANYDLGMAISGCTGFMADLILLPFQIMWICAIIWVRLRKAVLVGMAVTFPVYVLAVFLIRLQVRFTNGRVVHSHARLQLLQETLHGIRTIKAHAWDQCALKNIMKCRAEELRWLWWSWLSIGGFKFVAMFIAFYFIIATLGGYVWIYGHMNTAGIFVCLQALLLFKGIMEGIKDKMSQFLLIFPSMARVEKFFAQSEAPKFSPEHFGVVPEADGDAESGMALRVTGSFSWKCNGQPVLKDLDIVVNRGELVGVVGAVGSGKSSLLNAMLGELWPVSQGARVDGQEKTSYCPKVPWIQEATIRQNVVFASEYDLPRYQEVIQATGLRRDLEMLPGGEDAQVGSKGILLSSGQKARVSLARAAYAKDSTLALLDDPLAALDAPAGKHLLENVFNGSIFKGQTCVVVLQPEIEKLDFFDRIIVLEEGCVVFDGPPAEAESTEAFRQLLASAPPELAGLNAELHSEGMVSTNVEKAVVPRTQEVPQAGVTAPLGGVKLRDEEYQTRATWNTLKMYVQVGGCATLVASVIFNFFSNVCFQMANVTFAVWVNWGSINVATDIKFALVYVFWIFLGALVFCVVWLFGCKFSWGVSESMHRQAVSAVLRAPIDQFFDRHPHGRVMTRLSSDLACIDTNLFSTFTGLVNSIWSIVVPLFFIHMVMPWFFAPATSLVYAMIMLVAAKYWKVMIPLRYLNVTTGSDLSQHFVELREQSVSVRAYQEQAFMAQAALMDMDKASIANFATQTVIAQWIYNTIEMSFCIQATVVALVAVHLPHFFGPGTLGLCLINSSTIQASIGNCIGLLSSAQYELISLHRLWELTPQGGIPQERPMHELNDGARSAVRVQVERAELVEMDFARSSPDGLLSIMSRCSGKVLLQQAADGAGFVLAAGASFHELAPGNENLLSMPDDTSNFRLIGVNVAFHDVTQLAVELCSPVQDSKPVVQLEFRSSWLATGLHVEVHDLRTGYGGGWRPDILHDVSFEVEANQRAAIVGTTGCGKTTTLLALLRILEPRSGRIMLNGVDTQTVGLWCLRSSIGFVPEEPVLFSGTLRHNLDISTSLPDEQLWQALHLVQFADRVKNLPGGLDFVISESGDNLGFGHRQLICLARMVVRHPALLLLDEAASAIDPKTQTIIQQAISMALKDSTIIAAAHRLETILDFDVGIVLDRGCVVESGPINELVTLKGGVFASMLSARKA